MRDFIQTYFQQFKDVDEYSLKNNKNYFESLFEKYLNQTEVELIIHQPEKGITSNIIPLPILDEARYPVIQEYGELKNESPLLKGINLIICKMHAGLGSSVKRLELLKKVTGRKKLGSKGTDLFIKVNGEFKSLAQLQLDQAFILDQSKFFKSVRLDHLVNDETHKEVRKLTSAFLGKEILQLKVPTICNNTLSSDRIAPGGHAFLGYSLLCDIFENSNSENDLIVIGNGEDLNSTPDNKILSWVAENDVPITMMTTTKLKKDKKGGQISVVTGDIDYVTIVEKAQAEKANQLHYFEELGLRDSDKKSLFNTNIVIINSRALKEKLKLFGGDLHEFQQIISPDLIKNKKTQDNRIFTQLEGAIGSTMLNLDKYFRLNHGLSILSFLNLDPMARENFFIPIKTIEDFHELVEKYEYNIESGRFDLKEK